MQISQKAEAVSLLLSCFPDKWLPLFSSSQQAETILSRHIDLQQSCKLKNRSSLLACWATAIMAAAFSTCQFQHWQHRFIHDSFTQKFSALLRIFAARVSVPHCSGRRIYWRAAATHRNLLQTQHVTICQLFACINGQDFVLPADGALLSLCNISPFFV